MENAVMERVEPASQDSSPHHTEWFPNRLDGCTFTLVSHGTVEMKAYRDGDEASHVAFLLLSDDRLVVLEASGGLWVDALHAAPSLRAMRVG